MPSQMIFVSDKTNSFGTPLGSGQFRAKGLDMLGSIVIACITSTQTDQNIEGLGSTGTCLVTAQTLDDATSGLRMGYSETSGAYPSLTTNATAFQYQTALVYGQYSTLVCQRDGPILGFSVYNPDSSNVINVLLNAYGTL